MFDLICTYLKKWAVNLLSITFWHKLKHARVRLYTKIIGMHNRMTISNCGFYGNVPKKWCSHKRKNIIAFK